MADQPQSNVSGTTTRTSRVVFRTLRSAGYVSPEEFSDDLVAFEAPSGARRHSDSHNPSRTGQQESSMAGPSSQGTSGNEHPTERAPSELSYTSDDFLPYGPVRRVPKCCEKRRRKWWLLGGVAFLVVVAILALIIRLSVRPRKAPVPPAALPPWLPWRERTDDNGIPRLLLWNADEPGQSPSLINNPSGGDHSLFNRTVCKVKGSRDPVVCEITDNRRRLVRSDAIVFYADHLNLTDMPVMRADLQMWVFWARTRLPLVGKGTADNPSLSLPLVAGAFNWTMAKREDADVVLPHDTFRCHASGDKLRNGLVDRFGDAAPIHPKGSVAWILGDCEYNLYENAMKNSSRGQEQSGKDDDAVLHLQLFPACGVSLCGSPKECVRYIAQRYLFILVTLKPECYQTAYEMIYEAFKYNLIPVVLMPSTGTLNVPKNSVITSAKLQGSGKLAKYLRSVLAYPEKYLTFFAWKKSCTVVPTDNDICALCRTMWETPMHKRSNPNVLEWWTQPTACQDEPLYGLDSAFVKVP